MNTTDLAGRIEMGEHRMDSMEERLDTSFALLSSQILQSRRETNDAILATRADLSGDITALRTEMSGEFAVVRTEMSGTRSEFAGEFSAVRSEMSAMRGETQDRFEKLETTLAAGLKDARHYMKLLYEDLVSRIALLGDAWPPRQ